MTETSGVEDIQKSPDAPLLINTCGVWPLFKPR